MPVVSGRRPSAGRGPVRRDQQEPGRGKTLRRVWGRVLAEVQPGQILPGLRGVDAPEERSRAAEAKIPVFGRTKINVQGQSRADKNENCRCGNRYSCNGSFGFDKYFIVSVLTWFQLNHIPNIAI